MPDATKSGETYRVDTASADVRAAMAARCDEQGHTPQSCCTAMLHVYKRCRWCGRILAF